MEEDYFIVERNLSDLDVYRDLTLTPIKDRLNNGETIEDIAYMHGTIRILGIYNEFNRVTEEYRNKYLFDILLTEKDVINYYYYKCKFFNGEFDHPDNKNYFELCYSLLFAKIYKKGIILAGNSIIYVVDNRLTECIEHGYRNLKALPSDECFPKTSRLNIIHNYKDVPSDLILLQENIILPKYFNYTSVKLNDKTSNLIDLTKDTD